MVVMGALLSMGVRCSDPETQDGGYQSDGGSEPVLDGGHEPDAGRIECLMEGDVCVPAFEGAACGPAFLGSYVDRARRCIDQNYAHRIAIGCLAPMYGGTDEITCYEYEGPSGSGVAMMPGAEGPLVRTAITATRCSLELYNEVQPYPPCE